MGGLHGSVGGATPGKYLMGLSVVATDYITTVAAGPDGDRVRIEPGGNLGFWRYMQLGFRSFTGVGGWGGAE